MLHPKVSFITPHMCSWWWRTTSRCSIRWSFGGMNLTATPHPAARRQGRLVRAGITPSCQVGFCEGPLAAPKSRAGRSAWGQEGCRHCWDLQGSRQNWQQNSHWLTIKGTTNDLLRQSSCPGWFSGSRQWLGRDWKPVELWGGPSSHQPAIGHHCGFSARWTAGGDVPCPL